MEVLDSIVDAIGSTPLVRLPKITQGLAPTILAKLELLNPGGSVKDRIGIAMIEDAERSGLLKPGGTIVEPTSGNTGMGLAMVAVRRGYKMIFTMPDKMSEEKRRLLRAFGARVVITPTNVPPESPENYYQVALRLAREIPGGFMPNQYMNPANPDIHYRTTGPEIWKQTDGRIDVFVCGMGTGGTITGVARYLREKRPSVRIVGVDPEGSIYYDRFHGREYRPVPYKVEGIGEEFMPQTIDLNLVDEVIRVSDRDSFLASRRLAREEGILVGGSGGSAMYATLEVAQGIYEDKLIVVLLPDTGRNYLSKIYSDDWMIEHGFLEPERPPIISTVQQVLAGKRSGIPNLVAVSPAQRVGEAVELLRKYDISQLPVVESDRLVGSVYEEDLIKKLVEGHISLDQNVRDVMGPPLPAVQGNESVVRVYHTLAGENPAVVVLQEDRPVGILTRIDMIGFMTQSHPTG
jgi:cystathionine beta-synthase